MNKSNYVNMKVHPDFKRNIKTLAAESNLSMIKLTERIGKKKNEKEFEFPFKI